MGLASDLSYRIVVRHFTETLNSVELTHCFRAYYAILGSDLGSSVAWLLARHKTPVKYLGMKTINSIRVFHADYPPGMSAEEAQKYYTPVLLFEIVDVNDNIRTFQKAAEMAWTADPASAFHA